MAQAEAHPAVERSGGELVRRHRLSTRLWHWTNAAVFFVMLMSGLMIFNAHPRLYWGAYGANFDPAWLEIGADDGRGFLRIGGVELDTTGVLGAREVDGRLQRHAFPGWATIPSSYNLALARRWHLTFAWAFAAGFLAYGLWSIGNGHLRRDLLPRRAEVTPRHLWAEVRSHARLRFARGEAARRYNALQKLAYLAVVVVLIPVMIMTGPSECVQ